MSSSVSGEISNKYLSLHLPIQHKEQMAKLAGHHKNLDDASSHKNDCVFCREERMRERLQNSVKLDSFIENPSCSKITNVKYYKNSCKISQRVQIYRKKKRVSFRI